MRPAVRILHLVSYLAFRFCVGLIRFISLDCTFILGQASGEIAYRILRKRRALALNNLRLAFGSEMSEDQLRQINRRHFQLLGANLLTGLKASTMPHKKIWERVTLNLRFEPRPGGGILLLSHTGNWELYSHLGERSPEYRYGAVYQTLANPFIDRYLRAARMRSGITLFDRRTQLLSCVRFLHKGGVLAVLVDQGAGYAGLWTPLFGKLSSSSTLAASLALRTGLPVVPISITTCGRARWTLDIPEPIYLKGDDPEALTAQINRLLEEQIRRSPADWLWAHNRWKALRPHFLFARDQRRVFFPPDFDRSTLDPFRILVVAPDSATDAAATFPAVRAIKEGRPDISLTVLTNTESAEAWKGNRSTDYLIEWDREESVFSLASKIRKAARFEVAIFLANSWKTSLAVWKAGIPLRVGQSCGLMSWFYNQRPAEPSEPLDPLRMNLHIARSVGAHITEAMSQADRCRDAGRTI
jgi:heptosyltransferase-2